MTYNACWIRNSFIYSFVYLFVHACMECIFGLLFNCDIIYVINSLVIFVDAAVEVEKPVSKKKRKKKSSSVSSSAKKTVEPVVETTTTTDFSTAILGSADKNAMTVVPFEADDEEENQGHSVVGMTESVSVNFIARRSNSCSQVGLFL